MLRVAREPMSGSSDALAAATPSLAAATSSPGATAVGLADCMWQAPVVTSPMPTAMPRSLPSPKYAVSGVVSAGGRPLANTSVEVFMGGYRSSASIYQPVADLVTDPAGRYPVDP